MPEPQSDAWEQAAKDYKPLDSTTTPTKEPGLLDKADTAITDTLAPNPQNYTGKNSLLKTNAIEVPKTLGREVYGGAKSILGIPGSIYHAFADEPTDEEKGEQSKFETQQGEEPGTESSGMKRVGLGLERLITKPIGNAITDYSQGKVTPEAALSVAPEAMGIAGAQVLGGKALDVYAPKVIGAAKKTVSGPIPEPEVAARTLTKAVNPAVNEWPNYIKANAAEAGNIKAFAQKNNLPLKTQLDWAKAARGAADEGRSYFQEKVLGPHADESVSTAGTGYKGPNAGEGQRATLGEVNARIGKINDELRSAYQKKESGQTREALANDADLVAEKNALTDVLHKELAQRTGLKPEDVAGLRQRFGKMYSIADQTDAAVNQRQSSAGKAGEGRRDIPLTTAGAVADVWNKVKGGPEGIANRQFRRAIGQTGGIQPTELPQVNAPAAPVNTARPLVPREQLPQGRAIPVVESTPEEIAAQQQRLDQRVRQNQSSNELTDQVRAAKRARIPLRRDFQ